MLGLRQIEVFHAVYSTGSVSEAARMLNCSQPSVSKVLQHAESLIGFPLFERKRGRLVPTEDAHALFGVAADVQARVDMLRLAAGNLRTGRGGALRLLAVPSLALKAVPDAVAAFLTQRPDTFFDLQTVHHEDIARRLYEREADLAIGYDVPRAAAIASRRIAEGELVLLYREEDLPAAPPTLTLAEVARLPFVSLMRSGPIGALLATEFGRQGLQPAEAISVRTFFIAASLVRAGVGITVVDSFTAAAVAGPGLSWRPLRPAIRFDIQSMHLESRPPARLASAFLATLAKTLARP